MPADVIHEDGEAWLDGATSVKADDALVDARGSNLANLRARALEASQQGDIPRAEKHYLQVLESAPADAQALQFVAAAHFARGDATRAVALLLVADQSQPGDSGILHQLGAAQSAVADWQGAANSLRRCVSVDSQAFAARLRLGIALEQLGDSHGALVAYFAAVNTAQNIGRWLSDDTTAPGLRVAVKHAMGAIDVGRRHLFNAVMEPLRRRYGSAELKRVDECLAIYLGERPANLPDPRQQPKFLYFPGVPSIPYYPRERFAWQAELESNTDQIRDELCRVLAQPQDLESFLQTDSPLEAADLLRSSREGQPAWDAYFFHRHGERYESHALSCPVTAAILDKLPLAYVRQHSPETLFSVLRPGTHILPHRGVTNTRLVTHLPLIVPPDCALRVGAQVHAWEEGRCVTFDDTFEHEAWNRSDQTRVVLIVDSWNPDLTPVECEAVSEMVGAIGDFNRECEVVTRAN